jgi:tetratricopeptide (TPR) repeat protein/phenylpyruvate tautomerase PptA (4-oxalocrotonate tautomerase family)
MLLTADHPRSAKIHHLCGLSQIELGAHAEARPILESAVRIDPELAEAHADLALVLSVEGRHEEAEKSCRRAISLQPADLRFRLRLVGILEGAGREQDALAELAVAQEYAPEQTDLLLKVCAGLEKLGRYAEMLKLAERAIAENGESFDALSRLAIARHGTGDMAGAVRACEKALKLNSGQAGIYVTLGAANFEMGRLEEAHSAYRRALKLDPKDAAAGFSIGLVNLLRYRYRDGWEAFDQRFQAMRFSTWRPCEPRWNGGSLRGRGILIMREQGLGDEIMYASCYSDITRQASHCFVECDPRLERLFARSFPGVKFFPLKDRETTVVTDPGATVDVRTYAGSLPRYLRGSIRDFPNHSGYLHPDPDRITYWKNRLAELGPGMKIGISWKGGTAFTRRPLRSMSLATLTPLLSTPGVHWVNLQYGSRADDIAAYRESNGIPITDWPDAIDGDYEETAALVKALDLVISVTTSVVHLAGALGQKTWVMVAYVPEWRYGAQGETMPWYPSLNLIRQPAPQDWDSVVSRLVDRLNAELASRAK